MNKNIENTKSVGASASLDGEALRRLGGMQRTEALGTVLAIVGVLGCMVSLLIFGPKILAAVFFAVAAAGILLGSNAQKKKKAFIRSSFGDFFRSEYEKAFGPEPQTVTLPIDEAYLRSSRLTGRMWEKCEVQNFHEGFYRGIHFSAANVILTHIYQEKVSAQDGMETRTQDMLKGVVIRCCTACGSGERVYVRERIEPDEPDGILTPDDDFNRRFITESPSREAALSLLTPQLIAALKGLEASFRNEMGGLILDGGTLSLAFNTSYVFADVPATVDARDSDAVRKWYTSSLTGMCGVLDRIIDNTALF